MFVFLVLLVSLRNLFQSSSFSNSFLILSVDCYILIFSMLVYLSSIYLYIFQCTGGDKERRTPDLLLARQAL